MENIVNDILFVENLLSSIYTKKDLVELAIALGRDRWYLELKAETENIIAKTPPTPAQFSQGQKATLLSSSNLLLPKCTMCSRRKDCISPVPGEGFVDAKLFVVTGVADWIDDRTQIPLSGTLAIKTGICNRCVKITSCYKDSTAQLAPEPCIPELTLDCKEVIQNIKIQPDVAGQQLNSILLKIPEVTRKHWEDYIELRTGLNLASKEPVTKTNLYITNAVKCFSSGDLDTKQPTFDELMACRPWLLVERKLVSANITIALGKQAAESILGVEVTNIDDLIDTHSETKDFGMVYFTHSPKELLNIDRISKEYLTCAKSISDTFKNALKHSLDIEQGVPITDTNNKITVSDEDDIFID